MILWWEKRRLIYNVLIIAIFIYCMYSYWNYPMKTIIGEQQNIINAIVFVFGVNLFYTLSWISRMLYYYYHDKKYISSTTKRWVLFILGTPFSLLWTSLNFSLEFDVLFA